MHIPDGFLSNEVAVALAVPAVAAVGYGLRRAEVDLDDRRVPLLGVTAAFVFAAQMLNFPVAGGTSGHFLGAALAAILLGPWLASLVLAVVLVAQAFVFADGGITALGANVFNMGVIGGVVAPRSSASPPAAPGWPSWPAPRRARSSWRSRAPCRSPRSCRRCSASTRSSGSARPSSPSPRSARCWSRDPT
jgi:hypothetical protein